MRYVIIPSEVQLKHRDGSSVRKDPTIVDGKVVQGEVMEAMTIFSYAECWWNAEAMAKGGIKGLRQAEKIMDLFDEAKRKNVAYIALEDADWEKLKGVVEGAQFFRVMPLEVQCAAFAESVLEAKNELPAALQPHDPEPAAPAAVPPKLTATA